MWWSVAFHSADGVRGAPVANSAILSFQEDPVFAPLSTRTYRQTDMTPGPRLVAALRWVQSGVPASGLARNANWTWYSADNLHQAFNSVVASSSYIDLLLLEGGKTVPEFSLIFSCLSTGSMSHWQENYWLEYQNTRGKSCFSVFCKIDTWKKFPF